MHSYGPTASAGGPDRDATTGPGVPGGVPGPPPAEAAGRSREQLMEDFGRELRAAVRAAERRGGRAVDKAVLARRACVSRNSVYAYLSGRRLPSPSALDAILLELRAEPEERRRLEGYREQIVDYRFSAVPGPVEGNQRDAGEELPATAPTTVVETESPPDPVDVADNRPPLRPAGRLTRRPGRRALVLLVAAGCLVAAGAGYAWKSGQPAVDISKGASAVGHVGSSGHTCDDPSCAYVTIRIRHFVPNHTYLATCHSNGGKDPLENRNGYNTVHVSTDGQGNARLSGGDSCLWGYQATQVWVTVHSNDGIADVTSNRVDW